MKTPRILIAAGGMLAFAAFAVAQRPGADRPADDTVARMMAHDKNKDGKLTKAELDDDRLHRLFDRADADMDGSVTKDELARARRPRGCPRQTRSGWPRIRRPRRAPR